MTRKSISKRIDQITARVAAAHNLDTTDKDAVAMVNGKVWEVLHRFEAKLIAATNPPAQSAPVDENADWGLIDTSVEVEETEPALV